jgi:hypothetical protein
MSGIKDLDVLLKSMKPELIEGEYVFCTVQSLGDLKPLMTFKEKEGLTLILRKQDADQNNISYQSTWAMITLTVHSNLEAVGFLAKITEKLAQAGISVNAVSAYYHDHLFVPKNRALEAIEILKTSAVH